jgi:hypothetical protein
MVAGLEQVGHSVCRSSPSSAYMVVSQFAMTTVCTTSTSV